MSLEPVVAHLEAVWSCSIMPLGSRWDVGYAFCKHGQAADALGEIWAGAEQGQQLRRMGGLLVPLATWKAARDICGLAGLPYVVVVLAGSDLLVARITDFRPDLRADPVQRTDGWRDDLVGAFLAREVFRPVVSWDG